VSERDFLKRKEKKRKEKKRKEKKRKEKKRKEKKRKEKKRKEKEEGNHFMITKFTCLNEANSFLSSGSGEQEIPRLS
jgi:hypothetical protein